STEALQARKFMSQMGVAADRVTIEDKSRNTDENARFTAAIVHPRASQHWLVVTSAFHMPRVIFDPAKNLQIFQFALHEWIGLAAYWASGRIDHLFPGPGNDE